MSRQPMTEDSGHQVKRTTDLLTVIGFWTAIILLILNFMLRFADLGAIYAEYNQF
jgi:hypothetical protein